LSDGFINTYYEYHGGDTFVDQVSGNHDEALGKVETCEGITGRPYNRKRFIEWLEESLIPERILNQREKILNQRKAMTDIKCSLPRYTSVSIDTMAPTVLGLPRGQSQDGGNKR